MESKYKDIEFFLGYNPKWEEFEIIEHNIHSPNGVGTFCFRVGADMISDGDGFPASYDNTYVKIQENDFLYVTGLFHKAGSDMGNIALKQGRAIDRPLAPDDYIYDGSFIHIQNISDDREKLWIEEFYYNTYDLDIHIELNVVGRDDDYNINEMESDGLFLTSEFYQKALYIAQSAIIEVSDYLATLYKKSF